MALTLRGLSLFLKMFPISNIAAYISVPLNLAPFLTLSTTCLPGLESPQVLRWINSNAVLSLFWQQLGQTKQLHCIYSYTHDLGFYIKKKVSATHQIVCAGSLKPQIA